MTELLHGEVHSPTDEYLSPARKLGRTTRSLHQGGNLVEYGLVHSQGQPKLISGRKWFPSSRMLTDVMADAANCGIDKKGQVMSSPSPKWAFLRSLVLPKPAAVVPVEPRPHRGQCLTQLRAGCIDMGTAVL
ncbi:hypothetical protein PQR06_32455 [Paraburkholderia graminis]